MFVGTIVEGVVCVVLLAFWTAIVSLISEAGLGLNAPDDPTSTVENANLYYFSWAGFITCVAITVDYIRDVYGIDASDTLRNGAPRLELWAGMIGIATVVMGSSTRVLRNDCNYYDDGFSLQYCTRTRFGIAVGTLSLLTSIVIVYMKVKGLCALKIEAACGLFLIILNTFGVGYITAADSPGSTVGNLYYFSWGAFLLSAFISFHCYGEWSGHDQSAVDPTAPSDRSTPEQPHINGGDIEISTLEEENI